MSDTREGEQGADRGSEVEQLQEEQEEFEEELSEGEMDENDFITPELKKELDMLSSLKNDIAQIKSRDRDFDEGYKMLKAQLEYSSKIATEVNRADRLAKELIEVNEKLLNKNSNSADRRLPRPPVQKLQKPALDPKAKATK